MNREMLNYRGWFGDWITTISVLLVLSFIGASMLLSATEPQKPQYIYLETPREQVLSTSTDTPYIYDANR